MSERLEDRGEPTPAWTDPRVRAAAVSLVVGTLLLVAKYIGYLATGSTAILSDALESITNVLGASFALGGLLFAIRPADQGHPYGHGKVEFMAALVEGGLISFAAVLIIGSAIREFVVGPELQRLDFGLVLTLATGLVNAWLGAYLVRVGTRYDSLTLIADGRHVLADFNTSLAVLVGLGLARLTGNPIFDPIAALVIGANLLWTGVRLVRRGAGGLLDEEDGALLARIVAAFDVSTFPGIIRVHRLRAIRSGALTHADAHLIVPEYWTVEAAHEAVDAFETAVLAAGSVEGEIVFHTDPCRRSLCRICDVSECPVRREEFTGRPPLTLDEARQPDDGFWKRWAAEPAS